MTITIQPRSGSFSIDLEQTYVELSDSNTKFVLKYEDDEFHDTDTINGDFFQAAFYNDLNSIEFGVIVLEDADGSLSQATPVINQGDLVMLSINLNMVFSGTTGLTERTEVWGLVQPEDGAPAVFSFTTPASFAANLIFSLY
jgi:flagellin FlaB